MFATLSAPEQPARRRAFFRRKAPALSCSRVTLPNFFSFYHIQAPRRPDGTLPWDEIAETAGPFRTRLLLPRGIAPDEGAPVAVFAPQRLPLVVLCRSARQTLERLRADPQTQRLCVFDPLGVLADQIMAFAPLAAQLHVVTDAPELYEETAARLREDCGLLLRLSPDPPDLAAFTVLLLDDEADVPQTYDGLVFTNRPCPRMNAVTFTPEEPALPPEFAALCPPGIDPLQFASAAFELCAADELGGLRAECRTLQDGERKEAPEPG